MKDLEALDKLAEKFNELMAASRENEAAYGERDSEVRFAKKKKEYKSYLNIDLNTLEQREVEVYNKRGWAYSLLTSEDMKLLEEKLNTPKKNLSKNVLLDDGSRVFEVNNKTILVDNNYKSPAICAVLAISAESSDIADLYREDIYYEHEYYKTDRKSYERLLQNVSFSEGEIFTRFYNPDDFGYRKGQTDTGERAVLPDDFENYGYYGANRNRTGGSGNVEEGISESDTSEPLKGKKSKNDAWAEGDDGKIYSQNFKEWFGDWLNNPQNASKVVDKNGKPLVVYHQTAADFTVFNTDNPLAGLNDSETPNGIFFKTNDHDIGLEGKKQMPVYLNIRKMLSFTGRPEANRWYRNHIKGYETLDETMKHEIGKIEEKMNAIEAEMFLDDISDEEYEKLEQQWDSLLKEMKAVEDDYRGKLRKLLDDYFLSGTSGYDGIHLVYDGHRYVNGKREDVETYIVFKNTQVKSAKDNIGTFDKSNPDIRYSKDDAFYFGDSEKLKEQQNNIIQQNNSMHDDYHTGIRGIEDIYTFEEALENGEYEEGEDFSPDYTWQTAQRAVSSGKITVYSSYPIKQGVFVTPSKRKRKLLREK